MSRNWPVLLVLFLKLCSGYHPVVLLHGILTGPASMLIIEGEVKKVLRQIRLQRFDFIYVAIYDFYMHSFIITR